MSDSRRVTERNLSDEAFALLEANFKHHAPHHDDIIRMHQNLREMCRGVAAALLHLPPCREQAIALTKIEEAVMWGNAAIARHQESIIQNLKEQRGKEEEGSGSDGDQPSPGDS